jgi:hypothetical protein
MSAELKGLISREQGYNASTSYPVERSSTTTPSMANATETSELSASSLSRHPESPQNPENSANPNQSTGSCCLVSCIQSITRWKFQ